MREHEENVFVNIIVRQHAQPRAAVLFFSLFAVSDGTYSDIKKNATVNINTRGKRNPNRSTRIREKYGTRKNQNKDIHHGIR